MLAGIDHLHVEEIARRSIIKAIDKHLSVNFRRICRRTRDEAIFISLVDDDPDVLPDLGRQTLGRNIRLHVHQTAAAFLTNGIRQRARQRISRRPGNRRIGETADTVEPGFLQKGQKFFKFRFRLAGESRNESAADRQLRTDGAPGTDTRQRVFAACRTLHRLEDTRAGVLKRHIEIRQDFALRHQRDQLIDRRIRIDVMQAHPDAEFGQRHT